VLSGQYSGFIDYRCLKIHIVNLLFIVFPGKDQADLVARFEVSQRSSFLWPNYRWLTSGNRYVGGVGGDKGNSKEVF
jgi:hypothetical protein